MRKRTEKSKYKHQSTGAYCTCAAYIAEIMCMKHAEVNNEGSLPYKFWNVNPWKWRYMKQLYAANALLKTYSEAGVIKAINSPEFRKIFSLKNKRALPIIKKYDKIVKDSLDKHQELDVKENPTSRSTSFGFGKKSKLNKLRNMKFNGETKEQQDG
jgi:hypothetical protein